MAAPRTGFLLGWVWVLVAWLLSFAGCCPAPGKPRSGAEEAQASRLEAPSENPLFRGHKQSTQRRFAFAWPVPAKVTVIDDVDTNGDQIKVRYTLVASPIKGSDRIAVSHSDVEILEAQGQPAAPYTKDKLATAMAASLPRLVITEKGRIHGTSDQIGVEAWRAWVEMWVGLRLEENQEAALEVETALPGGATVVQPLVVRHMGYAQGDSHRAAMKMTSVQQGPEFRELIAKTVSTTLRDLPGGPDELMKKIRDARQVFEVIAVLDPDTLRPFDVKTENRTEITIDNIEPIVRTQRHHYLFHWETDSDR